MPENYTTSAKKRIDSLTATRLQSALDSIGLPQNTYKMGDLISTSPVDSRILGRFSVTTAQDADAAIRRAHTAFHSWRLTPAPQRGELLRQFAEILRHHKSDLATLITLEMGKIYQEALGEVQEIIDICVFAQGLSRQLYGLTIASERPEHRMMETWHPLGVVGLITPFNFPAAVWAWNLAIAIVCGNSTVWKPSEKTPLVSTACQFLFEKACTAQNASKDLSVLLLGGHEMTALIAKDERIPLVSATGSEQLGRYIAQTVAPRFGRTLLELGGNNAMILTASADLSLAIPSIVFSAVGTTGQRCTTLRRLFIHESIYTAVVEKIKKVYALVRIGSPLLDTTLCGPLIDHQAHKRMQKALEAAIKDGGRVWGGRSLSEVDGVASENLEKTAYVTPALVEMPSQTEGVLTETFAPILYVMPYKTLNEAIDLQNAAREGLSSSIFTKDIQEAELFMSTAGSDCGIANVNIGPSGAEIGGAFGGEKATGGGRESGSDAWKQYMRRATNTINYSSALPLAQGIQFNIEGSTT